MNHRTSRQSSLARWFHAARVGMVVALLLAIPSPQQRQIVDAGAAPSIDVVQALFEEPVSIEPIADGSGMWTVNNASGEPLSKIARTLPLGNDIVGYRGPTEAMIVLDSEFNIDRVALLASTDTPEHVDAVLADGDFFAQFRHWPWGGPAGDLQVDAVSGATLTSMALAESVLRRIGGDRPSLVFPDDLSPSEQSEWADQDFPESQVIRTGPISDDIAGYQGPTELLFQIDQDRIVRRIAIRESFDNEPYVDYVRTEAYFWSLFTGKTIDELAVLDPEAERIEGVSGATMTSLAVADTIVAAAKGMTLAQQESDRLAAQPSSLRMRWSLPDIATVASILLLGLFSWRRWFRIKWLRTTWLLWIIAVIGLWAGNLVSMALLAGWGAEGIAWRLAPGLAAIAVVAMLTPATTKGNPYCNHLCPHGAVQQLIRPRSKSRRRIRLSGKVQMLLRWIPGTTLVIAYAMLLVRPTIDLSSWEPFHAYLFQIASWSAIGMTFASLAIAAVIPMGYCRLGCPTGRLLDYVRRSSQSHRIKLADILALALLIAAVATRWFSIA
ncbi:FMN-binding protein [Planctomycetes bacterium K23_9]|uniref:Electron transport complex subunit RsxG n=1 Tax=Stieleria marina TaxID=1930275 RepID=A0A517NZF3_9BACT|nr:Electron transport complex subunit RsxG [Planctomycetes bacterium K23_9]